VALAWRYCGKSRKASISKTNGARKVRNGYIGYKAEALDTELACSVGFGGT